MDLETVRHEESEGIGVALDEDRDLGHWGVVVTLEKRHEGINDFPDMTREEFLARFEPYEVLEMEGNILVTAGINLMLDLLIGAGGTVYSNANAFIGVGDGNGSVPTPAQGDTDLTAPTNKLRKAMNATYPQRGTRQCTWQSDFGTSDANFAWREWGVFNASSAGTMLNHKGVDMGTKVSGTWTLTVTISIS